MLSVIFEAISVYYKVSVSGLFVGIAILILLFINVIYTIHIIRDIIKRQQQEELDKRKKYRRDVLQLMQMLSTTIEAKMNIRKDILIVLQSIPFWSLVNLDGMKKNLVI